MFSRFRRFKKRLEIGKSAEAKDDGRRVFVVDGHNPNGGTYMNYSIGRIVSKYWNYRITIIKISDSGNIPAWSYDSMDEVITIQDIGKYAKEDDLLICSPSFSDRFFGLSFPGKKLMYIQDLTTYKLLDGFFDKYVTVSPYIRRYILFAYGINTRAIVPFIHHDHLAKPVMPWKDRPIGSTIVMGKRHRRVMWQELERVMRKNHPDVEFTPTFINFDQLISHRELLRIISEHRYFLWLSPLEGFGLPPLEAMMCGTTVVGFDNRGGTYFRNNKNALTAHYPDFLGLADLFSKALRDERLSVRLAASAQKTAAKYTYDRYEREWFQELLDFLE